VRVKKDDIFIIPFDTIHHDPEQWQEHDKFLPERFDSESPLYKRPDGKQRHPMAFIPFSGG